MPEWLWQTRESPARQLALLPLWLAEGAYRLGAAAHRAAYAWGLRRRAQLPCRVISVGNLTVGGSGKTPLVGWLAQELRASGRKLAILSRGVRGTHADEVNVVSDGERVLLGPAEVGDEPVLLARRVPGVPVLAGRNRFALGLRAAALFGVELCLLDDGFQHHRLVRDLDLVCIDAALGLGNGHVLPRGPLRESPRALRRAHAILWTRAGHGDEEPPRGVRLPAGVPQFRIRIEPRELRRLDTGAVQPVEALKGRRVGLLAALARPDRFEVQLKRLGAEVALRRVLPDHHLYKRSDIAGLDRDTTWITTAKDAVKIPPAWLEGLQVEALEEDVDPVERSALLDFVLRRLDAEEDS